MMTISDPDVQQFLDIEAEATDDEEGSEDEVENEMMMQFLDDETVASDHTTDPLVAGNHNENDGLDKFWDEYIDRAQIRGRIEGDQADSYYIENLLPFTTAPNDYPLWRIPCRVGVEYTAMQSLFMTAHDRHQVRSVTVRDSIPGYIYLEATMNTELTKLLSITPGIINSARGRQLRKRGIECSEYTDLFRMNDDSTRFSKGVWVTIKEGLYEGDVALVIGSKDWCIKTLVVPRLKKTKGNPQKRKRLTMKPAPNLFDPSDFPLAKTDPTNDNAYTLGSLRIEHGLCKKVYDFGALAIAETITYPLFKKFCLSEHPAIFDTDIPRPQEWMFEVNDRVEILSSGRMGHVLAIHPLYLEINRDLDPSVQSLCFIHDDHEQVRWYNVRKAFDIGDYVKVTGGPHHGKCGWLVHLEQGEAALDLAGPKTSTINLIEVKRLKDGEKAPYKIEEIIVPVNCLRVTPVQGIVGGVGHSGNPYVGREMKNPWIGRDVVVTKESHPLKGSIGTVRDVVRSNQEGNFFKLLVEFGNTIRPGLPFERILIPSEYVKEI